MESTVHRTLLFCFEELPLLIEGGFEAGDIAGSAEIAYHRDGEWSICTIALDGARRLINHTPRDLLTAARTGTAVPAFERQAIALDEGDPIYLRIYHRLEHEWRDKVHTAVIDQLAADYEAAADTRADRRRAF